MIALKSFATTRCVAPVRCPPQLPTAGAQEAKKAKLTPGPELRDGHFRDSPCEGRGQTDVDGTEI